MYLTWNFHAYTGVWTLVIVEVYIAAYSLLGLCNVAETPYPVYDLGFYRSIDPLCNGIVRWLIIFRHAYADIVRCQLIYICIATILHTTVGVMYQAAEIGVFSMVYRQFQCG